VEIICGGNLWRQSVEVICGGNLWKQSLEVICGGCIEWLSICIYVLL
jgi:hypothetical protein